MKGYGKVPGGYRAVVYRAAFEVKQCCGFNAAECVIQDGAVEEQRRLRLLGDYSTRSAKTLLSVADEKGGRLSR